MLAADQSGDDSGTPMVTALTLTATYRLGPDDLGARQRQSKNVDDRAVMSDAASPVVMRNESTSSFIVHLRRPGETGGFCTEDLAASIATTPQ
jgi:hypothetical protein